MAAFAYRVALIIWESTSASASTLACLVWLGFDDEARDYAAPGWLGKDDVEVPKRLRRRPRFEDFGVNLMAAINTHLPVDGLHCRCVNSRGRERSE